MAGAAQGRSLEWLTSAVMVLFAVTLAAPGNSLSGSAYRALRDVGADEAMIAVPLAVVGMARLGALLVNGAWHRSPVARMVGAIAGATGFAVLSATCLWPTLAGIESHLSTAVTTYAALALADGVSAYRSAADVTLARRAH